MKYYPSLQVLLFCGSRLVSTLAIETYENDSYLRGGVASDKNKENGMVLEKDQNSIKKEYFDNGLKMGSSFNDNIFDDMDYINVDSPTTLEDNDLLSKFKMPKVSVKDDELEKELGVSLGSIFPKQFGSNRGNKFKDSKKGLLLRIKLSHSPKQHIFGIQAVTSRVKNKFWGNKSGKNVTINTKNVCITGVDIVEDKTFLVAIRFRGKKGKKAWKSDRFGNFKGGKVQRADWDGCLTAFIGRSDEVLYKLGFIFN